MASGFSKKLALVNGKGRTTLGKGGLERPGEEGPIVEGPSKRGWNWKGQEDQE